MNNATTVISSFIMNGLIDFMNDKKETNKESIPIRIGYSKEVPKLGRKYHARIIFDDSNNSHVLNVETIVKKIIKVNRNITIIKTKHSVLIIGKNETAIKQFIS